MLLGKDAVRSELQAAGRYMMEHGLAWGNAGNISARTGEDRYLITASGTFLGELGDDDFAECTFGGLSFPQGRKASKEMPMHRAVYERRPEIGAVLHASPFYSTMFACSNEELPADLFVETMYYLERVERVPYCHPGSEELGAAVREKAGRANVLLLENHGVLVYDTNIREARMALQTLEMACRMLVTAKSAGVPLAKLPEQTVQHFLNHAGYKPRREWKA
ncbi:class II aldolase/adducin family protein [Paenibacillus rhizovicinus]|uniref:Class II aldolase/adducin family protein n=1 Tax=Paenibacillus rhizovicinus TaxID=2704463 RepID=A0A6C0P558_9BACL|nr:class II aldolase/adducin family protein [Paenibacillus rhizovicinus]QHW33670.1 class II aldolase/adducin family protein [Paenibacillus rhizovicinus]